MRNLLTSVNIACLLAVTATSAGYAAGNDAAKKTAPAQAVAKSAPAGKAASPSVAAVTDAKNALASMTPFEDKKNGVIVNYPKNWKMDQPQNGVHIARFKQPDASVSISLSSEGQLKNESLTEFVKATNAKTVKYGASNDFKVTIGQSKQSGSLGDAAAVRTEMKYDLPAPAPVTKVTTLTAMKGGRVYTLAYTSPAIVHDAYMPVFTEIAKSFKVTAAPSAAKEPARRTAIPAKLVN